LYGAEQVLDEVAMTKQAVVVEAWGMVLCESMAVETLADWNLRTTMVIGVPFVIMGLTERRPM